LTAIRSSKNNQVVTLAAMCLIVHNCEDLRNWPFLLSLLAFCFQKQKKTNQLSFSHPTLQPYLRSDSFICRSHIFYSSPLQCYYNLSQVINR
jgi:hypothetical protein